MPVGVTPSAETVTSTLAVPFFTRTVPGDTVAAVAESALATCTVTVAVDGLVCASPS